MILDPPWVGRGGAKAGTGASGRYERVRAAFSGNSPRRSSFLVAQGFASVLVPQARDADMRGVATYVLITDFVGFCLRGAPFFRALPLDRLGELPPVDRNQSILLDF
jgi:hypothetical protein